MTSVIPPPRAPRRSKTSGAKTKAPASSTQSGQPISNLAHWKLEDAKARFSEVVRLARETPQLVTVRGKEAVVILAPADYRRLVAQPEDIPLTDFLSTLDFTGIDLEREMDRGRDIDFFNHTSEREK